MKKTLLISILVLVLGIAIAIPIVIKARSSKAYTTKENESARSMEERAKKASVIENVVEYTGEIPNISIEMTGLYSTTVTSDMIKDNLTIYEFDAGIYDMYDTNVSRFIGVRYWDLIKYLKLPHNNAAMFISDRKSVSYRPSEIDYDSTFIVFYRDGAPIGNGGAALLAVNYSYGYSVEDLIEINTN